MTYASSLAPNGGEPASIGDIRLAYCTDVIGAGYQGPICPDSLT